MQPLVQAYSALTQHTDCQIQTQTKLQRLANAWLASLQVDSFAYAKSTNCQLWFSLEETEG